MLTGPSTEAPVDLFQTCSASLTIWTYWVRPTSPLVSGGAQLQPTPGKGRPPKLALAEGILGVVLASVSFVLFFRPPSPRLRGSVGRRGSPCSSSSSSSRS